MPKELDPKREYVVGFLFSSDKSVVLLIHKRRPSWQDGKLNGIGGAIEGDEFPSAAMRREFEEETGLDVDSWRQYCTLRDARGWAIHFFYTYGHIARAQAMTDEPLVKVSVAHLPDRANLIPNLHWLIPMALSMESETIASFEVMECPQ